MPWRRIFEYKVGRRRPSRAAAACLFQPEVSSARTIEIRSISSREPGGGAAASAVGGVACSASGRSATRDLPASGHEHGPLDGVLELAHVAGPLVGEQPAIRFGIDPLDLAPVLDLEPLEKGLGQEGNVRRALP